MSPRKKKSDIETGATEPQAEPKPKAKRSSARAKKPAEPETPAITPDAAEEAVAPEPPEDDESGGDAGESEGRIVVFTLAGQLYAFPIECVQEIQQIVAFTDCPDPVPALVGMVNLRGLVVPLVDLRLLLAMEPAAYTLETPMIICRVHGQTMAVAVDEVEDVVEMPAGCLQPAPRLHSLGEKMLGVCRMEPDLIFLLDPDAVLPSSATTAGGRR